MSYELPFDDLEEDFVVAETPVVPIAPFVEPAFDGYYPYVAPEFVPTMVTNEWNPDFFGVNPGFAMQEADRAAVSDRASALSSAEDNLMVLRTPKFSIAW